jgi:amino acid adenylation domain-containing protein
VISPAEQARAPEGEPQPAAWLPLSARQSLMWLDEQLYPDARYQNLVLTVAVDGPLDADRLARAWAQTVRDRDALRMAVDPRQARQRLLDADPPPLPVISLEPEALDGWLAERSVRRLGADGGFRWDAALLRLGPERHVFYLNQHHIVADGTSVFLLADHLAERYAGRVPAPCASFQDYLRAESQYRASPKGATDAAWWQRKLAAGVPPLRPYGLAHVDRSVGLARARLDGGRGRAARLAALAAEEPFRTMSPRLSRLLVMATALATYLYRVTGNREILLGVPFANRPPQFARTCGLLMEQTLLRIEVAEGETFETLARKVRAEAMESTRHGQACVSGEEYVTLNLVAAPPTRFADLPAAMRLDLGRTLGGPAGTEGDLRDTLRVHVFDFAEDSLQLTFDFHAATFDAPARRRAQGHFLRVLDALSADVRAPLDAVSLVDEAERRDVLAAAQGADPGPVRTDLVDVIADQARRCASRTAVIGPDARLGYAELDELSNRLARRLRSLGVVRESRVGVAVPRGARELLALLATLKAGGAYVPVDPTHPVDRVRVILEDAAPEVLVAPSDSPLREAVPPGTKLLPLDDLAEATEGFDAAPIGEDVAPGQTAYILFTSGSTGRPKGVEVPRGAFTNFLRSMAHTPGLGEGDRLLAVTTTTFDIAGLELFLPLWVGATVAIADRDTSADPRLLRARLESEPFTVMQATPATWRLLVDAGWQGDGRLRMFIGGEPLNPELQAKLLARGGELWNLYGPTETTVWSTVERIQPEARITIGKPIDRTQVYVLDPALQPVPAGVVGEIWIGGDGVARGYRGRPDLTAERFVADPFGAPGGRIYRTGDLGRLLDDGRFECLGRIDHQVKIRGFRIELGEIESVLRSAPGVKDAVVVADKQGAGDPRLVAYWVGAAERQALLEQARGKLPSYMVPQAYLHLDAFPLTTSGKVDRKSLPRPEAGGETGSAESRRPASEAEIRVAAVFRDVLGVPAVGVDDDFFALGGSSVLVIEARARLEKEFGVELPLRVFFETPTVSAIVPQLDRPGAVNQPFAVTLKRGRSDVPPLLCVVGIDQYQDVALALPGARPVVGLHVPVRYDPSREPYPAIEEVARQYVELVRREQPKGPYHLAGLCFGGVVAFEAARQLEAQGERVDLVAVLDWALPNARKLDLVGWVRAKLRKGIAWRGLAERLAERLRALGERVRRRRPQGPEAAPAGPIDLPIGGPAASVELKRYAGALGHLKSHLLVVKALHRPKPDWLRLTEDYGWAGHAERVTVEDVDSGHLELVRDPKAREVAAVLAKALGDGAPGEGPGGAPPRS